MGPHPYLILLPARSSPAAEQTHKLGTIADPYGIGTANLRRRPAPTAADGTEAEPVTLH